MVSMMIDLDELLSQLKCLFSGHKYYRKEAVERESDTWQRLEKGEVVENIDGCTIIEECSRCGWQVEMSASVETAKRMGIPLEWEAEEDQNE